MSYRTVIIALVAAAVALVAAAGAQARRLPVIYNGVSGYAHINPTASPPGANNWACRPSAGHRLPVILVHGTFADMADSWQAMSPLLFDNGYCVFAFNYGSYRNSGNAGIDGIGPIASSAGQLSKFVNRVLAATGATQVDLVGHSQGGMMPRYYIRFLGGAAKVHTLVGLAPSNHGTTLDGLFNFAHQFKGASALVGSLCPACQQQEHRSALIRKLNAGGETVPRVNYTVIQSRYDEVVTPYQSAFLSGPNVHNILLQNQCPLDFGEHLSMPYDHIAAADVLDALDPAHPVRRKCSLVLPIVGG